MSISHEELTKMIDEATAKQAAAQGADRQSKDFDNNLSVAMRTGVEIVSAVCVGGFIGYWIDKFLGSFPFGVIIMVFFGFIAGFLNIYREQTGIDYKEKLIRKNKE